MTDEELEVELAKLTPEEREELLADLEAKESGALAGQAYKAKYVQKVSPKVLKTSPALVKQAVRKLSSSLPSGEVPAKKEVSSKEASSNLPSGEEPVVDLTVTFTKHDYFFHINATGKYVNITSVTIENIGNLGTGTDFHTLFTTPVGLYVKASLALPPGGKKFFSGGVTYLCTTDHNIEVSVDNSYQAAYQNKIAEFDETNNGATLAVKC